MIKLLRKKFILISAASVFAVVGIIFIAIAILNYTSVNATLDTLTDTISEGNGVFPDWFDNNHTQNSEKPSDKPKADFITPDTRYSTRHFTVWLDDDGEVERINTEFIRSVSETDAVMFAESAFDNEKTRGWIGEFRYKKYSVPNGEAVVFVDGTMSRRSLAQTLGISAVVLISSSVVILLLIVLLSGKIIKPVGESYEKQKQFITDANHELKTPLTLILANLDIAESEVGKNEWLDDIRDEGQRMAELVNQLVELSRMDEEKHKICESEIKIGEMISETVAEFESIARERGKSLACDVDREVTCFGDEVMLRRLVGILMENAVKYCDCGGEIFVSLKKHRKIIITIENTYEEVNSLELSKLFDRFYRADKARKFTGGYGVGLSIAKSIVEKHKGEIYAYKKDNTHIGFKVIL